jgi:hypothetical protein
VDPDDSPESESGIRIQTRITRAPWAQDDREPDSAYALFVQYLTAPDDSIAAFARSTEGDKRALAGLAARWRWRARRAAYRMWLGEAAQEAALETAQDLGRRHGAVLAQVLDWAVESLAARRAEGELLTPSEALRYAAKAIELQRLIAGQATGRTAIDLSKASPEALDALEKALQEIEAGQGA